MPKNKISEFSSTPANNTDIAGINIAEGCAPSGINNAIRELMAQLKDQQAGTDGDNFTVGGNLVVTGTATLTGSATAPTATTGDSTTKVATTAFVQAALASLYPVGSIYINATSSTNPATLLGFGTWTAFGAGRVMVGLDAGNAAFDTAEETGGSADAIVVSHTHTATVTDPTHQHISYGTAGGGYNTGVLGPSSGSSNGNYSTANASTGITVSNSTTGSSGTNANLQPYIVVRMWKRTA
jgi:hypothetical protein